MKRFIVKVQVSLFSNRQQSVLIYNRNRNIMWEGEAEKEILELMGNAAKGFYFAHISRTKKIILDEAAPWQDW